ncbi:MAG: hypothetical protein HQK83_03865 [Fibrobacteria bacterium]|nr:hypothetical protein [Fibrobacteria bacterium]
MKYFNKTFFIFVAFILALSSQCWSDPLKLLKRNRFIDAIEAWEKDASLSSNSQKKMRALKGQAIAYNKLGNLYNEYQTFFYALINEYYKIIGKHYPSPTLLLYQGEVAYYNGSYTKCIRLMKSVMASGKADRKLIDMAKVYHHYALNKLKKRDGRLILKSDYPTVLWQLIQLEERSTYPKNLPISDARSIGNKLSALIRSNDPNVKEITLHLKSLLKKADEPEIILNKGKLTQVNFYNPILYKTISQAFFYLSNMKYERLLKYESDFPALSKKFQVEFSMAENYFELGKYADARHILQKEKSDDASILMAKVESAQGRNQRARIILDEINLKNASLATKRELGYTYFTLGVNKVKGLRLTAAVIRQNNSSKYLRRYASILLGLGKNQEALEVFAKGYKIQFRNSVEHIDPEYMTEYAYAIFKSSKMRYDEVVETLYHLQKAYPACRAMHYCMQGIAAAETRTFGNTRIFKKGG